MDNFSDTDAPNAESRYSVADAVLAEWGVERSIRVLRAAGDPTCAAWVRAFPALRRWCPTDADVTSRTGHAIGRPLERRKL